LAALALVALVLVLAWTRQNDGHAAEVAAARSLEGILGPELPALAQELVQRARPLLVATVGAETATPRGAGAEKIGEATAWEHLFLVDLDTGAGIAAPGFDGPGKVAAYSARLAPLIADARARLPDLLREGIADAFPLASCTDEAAAALCVGPASAGLVATADRGFVVVVVPTRAVRDGRFLGQSGTPRHGAMIGMRRVPPPVLARIAGSDDLGRFELVTTGARQGSAPVLTRRLGDQRDRSKALVIPLLASFAACGAGFVCFYTTRELAKSESIAIEMAGHDRLSGLPNRSLFSQFLDAEISRVARKGGGLALLYLDLDRFKEINDSFGHDAGDRMIVSVAHRMMQVSRGGDKVARFGGDEFAILQTDIRSPRDCELLARRLLSAVNEPFDLGERQAHAGISIGIALCPQDAIDRQELMRRADLALYRAKNEGRNRLAFFEARMGEELRLRKRAEDELRQAIDKGLLTVLYQPVVTADTQRLVAVEALVRWPHPTRGTVLPDDFIGLAEDRGLILPLGEWVLRRACSDASSWGDLRVAVNVSPVQFRQKEFVATVARIIAETELDPSRLELELTEGVIVEDADQAENAIIDLRAMGVRLALDDFGTGYSSLIYLRRFAFDKIKIDRSFLQSMESTGESAIIVHSVVQLGRALGLTVTAEGIETHEQHRFLQALGCHELQGYLFSKPVGAEAITRMVATGVVGGCDDEQDLLLSGAA
jgi:diguanylate cyclase (GGDEF)-like protein